MWSISKPISFVFNLEAVGGRWKYGFTSSDYGAYFYDFSNLHPSPEDLVLTAGELAKRADLKRIRVDEVSVNVRGENSALVQNCLKFLDLEIQKLLNFVSRLTDELMICTNGLQSLEASADGAAVKNWLEGAWFHYIAIDEFSAVDQYEYDTRSCYCTPQKCASVQLRISMFVVVFTIPMLVKRRRRRSPTMIFVNRVKDDEDGIVLQDSIKSGVLRKLNCASQVIIPFNVIEAVIANFRRDPDEFIRETCDISTGCEETTPGKLEEMREKGLCRKDRDNQYGQTWIFEAGQKRISVEYSSRNACRIRTLTG